MPQLLLQKQVQVATQYLHAVLQPHADKRDIRHEDEKVMAFGQNAPAPSKAGVHCKEAAGTEDLGQDVLISDSESSSLTSLSSEDFEAGGKASKGLAGGSGGEGDKGDGKEDEDGDEDGGKEGRGGSSKGKEDRGESESDDGSSYLGGESESDDGSSYLGSESESDDGSSYLGSKSYGGEDSNCLGDDKGGAALLEGLKSMSKKLGALLRTKSLLALGLSCQKQRALDQVLNAAASPTLSMLGTQEDEGERRPVAFAALKYATSA
jgi:hypothetical protein